VIYLYKRIDFRTGGRSNRTKSKATGRRLGKSSFIAEDEADFIPVEGQELILCTLASTWNKEIEDWFRSICSEEQFNSEFLAILPSSKIE